MPIRATLTAARALVAALDARALAEGRPITRQLAADVLAGRPLQRKRLCRTFSDCTTAPRNGMVSGCYPLDAHYKKSPQMIRLTQVKKDAKLS